MPVKVFDVNPAAPRLVNAPAAVDEPVPPFSTATIPVTFPAVPVVLLVRLEGISAATRARKVGAAAEPLAGPANTAFAPCVFNVAVNVPDDVTGLFVTVKILGIDKPTLVTAPAAAQFALPYTSMPVAYSPEHWVGVEAKI